MSVNYMLISIIILAVAIAIPFFAFETVSYTHLTLPTKLEV